MRRAGVACLVLAAGGAAAAEPSEPKMVVTAEGGAEVDSNVQQVETGPGLTEPVAAPVARLGAKLTRTGAAARGSYALVLDAQSKAVLSGKDSLSPENVVLLSGDLRWMHPIRRAGGGDRGVSAGVGLIAIDKLPVTDGVGDRTFRWLGAEGLLVLHGGEEHSLALALGGRDFVYQPDRTYDWRGPTATVRLNLTLWERNEGARSVELSALFGFEARAYGQESVAYASGCPVDAKPKPECYAATSLRRSDRFQRGALELTWTGGFVAAASYELSVTDSNSYGQSLVRHRTTLSATRNLPWQLFGTVLGTLVLDHYPDGRPIDNVAKQSFTTLDDENRSSLRVRIARHLGKAWAIEGSGVLWRDLGRELDATYRRAVLYVGAVYSR